MPMYTRRRHLPFVTPAVVACVTLALPACRPAPEGPGLPTPSPAPVQVGYGAQDRRDVNGAVSSASGDKLREGSPRTVADMLVGRFPGVEVRPLPNGSASIRIRGTRSFKSNEDPLIVVDGIPQASGAMALNDLTPRDVQSIEVLRDASATSVYGSRGANGVILVSTRRPM